MRDHEAAIHQILQALDSDKTRKRHYFPIFENMNLDYIAPRLSLYQDADRWAISISALYYSQSMTYPGPPVNLLYTSGNCVLPGKSPCNNICGILDVGQERLFVDARMQVVKAGVDAIRIRGEVLGTAFSHKIRSEAELSDEGERRAREEEAVDKLRGGGMWAHRFFRALHLKYPRKMVATDQEMRTRIPPDLPCILELFEWRHPWTLEEPSETQSFQQLAAVLASGDVNQYNPTEAPNTHWKYWSNEVEQPRKNSDRE